MPDFSDPRTILSEMFATTTQSADLMVNINDLQTVISRLSDAALKASILQVIPKKKVHELLIDELKHRMEAYVV